MSRVLEFADEVAGLTPGLDQAQTITNDFTTTANKNSVFFGSITFNATNPVAVVANSELIFHDADVDFKQGFNIQGTLNWITGGGTTNKDVSGLQINGTTVIDSNRNISNVPLIQATEANIGTKLQINGTTVIDSNRNISNVPLIQATEANIGTNALVVDASGNVGIGTASPQDSLHIVQSTTRQLRIEGDAPTLYFKETDGSADQNYQIRLDGGGLLIQTNNDAFQVASTKLSVNSGGNVGIGTVSPAYKLDIDGDDLYLRGQNAYSATSTLLLSRGRAKIVGQLEPSGGTPGTSLQFYTMPNGGSSTERMRIDSDGNVGIGITAPDQPLQVKGVIEAQASNSTNGWMMYTYTDNSFRLNYNGAGNDEVVITDNGYVGIGTTSPTSKLYVVDGGGVFDSQDSTGHARFTQASGSAQIGLFRSGSAVGGGYIGGDGSYLLNVFNTGFAKKASIDHNGNMNISGSLTQNSDIRLKENITDYTKGTTELMQIQVRQWQYNGKGETNLGQNGLGVIADEIENVLPSTVDTYPAKLNADDEIDTDIKRFAASEITWLLVNTCKEQQTIIESQQSQIDALTARIDVLENQ